MSVLLFGVSHRSAPVSVLEQLSTGEPDQIKLVERLLESPLVTEAMMLSTCNRVEVYAVVEAFHGGLQAIGQVLSDHSGMSMGDLTKHAYVRYSEAAVEHLFAVASGLDSAVVGEQQVLGQVRRAYATAESNRTVGRVPHDLSQRALSVGERLYRPELGPSYTALAGRTATVIGAGSMGSLTAAHLIRAGIGRINVVNRSLPRAQRLAEIIAEQGVDARAMTLDDLPAAMAGADLVVSCTGAVRPVVTLADVHYALAAAQRDEVAEPLVMCDLGMPRDIDPAVAGLPGVSVVAVAWVQREPSARAAAADADAARHIVAAEVAAYLTSQRMAEVAPTVTALRRRAADLVETELLRLENRVPNLDDIQREEVARTVRRVVDKLLHAPTVRVKQLAGAPGADTYAQALRELFELDPHAVDAVAAGEIGLPATESDIGSQPRRRDGAE